MSESYVIEVDDLSAGIVVRERRRPIASSPAAFQFFPLVPPEDVFRLGLSPRRARPPRNCFFCDPNGLLRLPSKHAKQPPATSSASITLAGDWSTPLPRQHAPLSVWRCPADFFPPIIAESFLHVRRLTQSRDHRPSRRATEPIRDRRRGGADLPDTSYQFASAEHALEPVRR